MNERLFSLLAAVHGHLATLGLAVLLHPVITLGRRPPVSRGTLWSADLALLLLVAPFTLALWLYPTYRGEIKPSLWVESRSIALLFETKEHLGFFAVVLAAAGWLSLRGARQTLEGRRVARSLFLLAWLCGVATAGLGMVVRSIAQPGW